MKAAELKRWIGHNWIWCCPVLVLAIGLLDLICTLKALHAGVLVELNPIMDFMIRNWGSVGLTAYRSIMTLLGCGLLLWALRMYHEHHSTPARWGVQDRAGRVRAVVWGGQAVLVASHLGLASWWTAWFMLY